MRVLHVIESLAEGFGGLSRTVSDMSTEMRRQGHEVKIVSFEEYAPSLRGSAVKAAGKFMRFGASRDFAGRIANLAANSDVVHVHGLWRMHNIYAARSALRTGIPFVVSTHGMLSPEALKISAQVKRLAWWAFQRGILNSAAAIHVTSPQEWRDVSNKRVGRKIVEVPHGFDFSTLADVKPTKQNIILFLGRIHPIKNLEVLIDAWTSISESAPGNGWELLIVGGGEPDYVTKLKHRAACCNNISFRGPVSGLEKDHLLATSSLLTLPSASENFGLVVLEALAQSTPVICSTGTPWQQVVEERCGLWVEPTVANWRAALAWFLEQPEADRLRMGHRGRDWAHNNFSLERTVERLVALYVELSKGQRR